MISGDDKELMGEKEFFNNTGNFLFADFDQYNYDFCRCYINH